MNANESNADREATRLERAAERTRETLEKAKDGVVAGASGLAEITKKAASETADKAGRVVNFVREAETDVELKEKVSHTAEDKLHQAGDKLSGAAPAIGRSAEAAAEKIGGALHKVAHPLAVVLGVIAGTVGGWWKKAAADASGAGPSLPSTEEQACRAHFATIAVLPPDMTFDRARTGYSLGYLASRNPDYQGRQFEDVEPDLRQGFAGEKVDEYEALREFARYGYGRGIGGDQAL
jgi:hypothetical protein